MSPGLYGIEPPVDLDELTEKTIRLSEILKDETPAVGEVKSRQMGGHPITLTYEPVDDGVFERNELTVEPLAHEVTVSGHWFDAEPLVGDADAVLLNFSFNLEEKTDVRLMVYYEHLAKTWLNGEVYASYDPGEWSEGYHGPSFHRFQDYSPAKFLPKGRHSFMIALKNNEAGNHDVVVGVGDAGKNLWISHAMIS